MSTLELSEAMKSRYWGYRDDAVREKYNGEFVGEFPLRGQSEVTFPVAVYYTGAEPNPKFGNRYFGLYQTPRLTNMNDPEMTGMICNADWVEKLNGQGVLDEEGKLVYSTHRHDMRCYGPNRQNFVDGGFDYLRYGGEDSLTEVVSFVIRYGRFVRCDSSLD